MSSQEGLIPKMPLFLGGLGTKITVLYDHYSDRVPRNYPGFRLLDDIDILVAPQISPAPPDHLPKPRHLPALQRHDVRGHHLQLVRVPLHRKPTQRRGLRRLHRSETPGYRLRTAAAGDQVILNRTLPPSTLQSRVESFDFSAHATREELAAYAEKLKPSKIILVHGEIPSQTWFENRFRETLPDTEVLLPEPHLTLDLW
jgi:hypothetical protein